MEYSQLGVRTLLKCFLRTYLVGAAFNTRGMQNVGLIFALEPGLRVIYPNLRARQAARRRYLRHYNTHMFWTPLLLGIFLSLEDKIALKLFPASVLDHVKNTTMYTLSAIGDSMFAGSLLVFWALSTTALMVADWPAVALILGIVWFVTLQIFKLVTFWIGFREGLKSLLRLRHWDIINWSQRLKLVNAVITTMILWQVWPHSPGGQEWLTAVAMLGIGAWSVYRLHVPREAVLLAMGAYLSVEPWFRRVVQSVMP